MGFEQLGLCTAVGFQALANNTTDGFGNSAFGYQALVNNTGGASNTANGLRALFSNTTGDSNTAAGNSALGSNTTGSSNTAIGRSTLLVSAGGSFNTAIGQSALVDSTSGNSNTAAGWFALQNNTAGNNNTAIGALAGSGVTTADNVICIGENVLGANVSDSCYIGNIFGATSFGGSAVFVNVDNKLGTVTSSRRFKQDIKPMDKASETLFALKPVAFRYKKDLDPQGIAQFGLVAEDVEKVNPHLVVRDKEGNPTAYAMTR
jgi:trimeric autotransporter adhesin